MLSKGDPEWVDLGEAAQIDSAVMRFRAALLKNAKRIEQDVKLKARSLDQKIMQPVRKLLGDNRTILISPDGALNLLPFAALVDEQGKYLIESYSLTYLTTGRDLLRLQTRMKNRQSATVFANPEFGTDGRAVSGKMQEARKFARKAQNAPKLTSPTKAVNLSREYFPPLPGTAGEATALKTIFPDAVIWTRAQATKTRLKQVDAPAFLHIATHGFFLSANKKGLNLLINTKHTEANSGAGFHVEDPMLKSGLALAGANLHSGGAENGILMAKEASGLNLWGTKLVVLSACDTGVGEVKNGEGVYGLRRALVLAGSESQVMSLWKVDDEATRDLMIGYYSQLKAGEGRGEALRRVQLKMLTSTNRRHPYYWASFIQSGEWANLDGRR